MFTQIPKSIYLVKETTRYEFVTLRGCPTIIRYTLITTDKDGNRLAKTTTCGGSYWKVCDFVTGEKVDYVRCDWDCGRKVTKNDGNAFYKDLIEKGYKVVDSAYKPTIE